MNGASAELPATARRTPIVTRTMTIGASQYFLLCFMYCQISLTTLVLDMFVTSLIHFLEVTRILLPRVVRSASPDGGAGADPRRRRGPRRSRVRRHRAWASAGPRWN